MKFSNFLTFLFFAFLFVSNPDSNEHKAALTNEAKRHAPLIGSLLGPAVGWATTYEDYYLVSTSSIGGEVISFGVMGKVFAAPAYKPGP